MFLTFIIKQWIIKPEVGSIVGSNVGSVVGSDIGYDVTMNALIAFEIILSA